MKITRSYSEALVIRPQQCTKISRNCVELLIVALLSAFALFSRFWFGGAFLAFYDDDFFYYLQIARNLAVHGISSFDGIHLTNGYHPLWLVVLTVLYKAFPGKLFFYAVEALTVISVVAVYALAKRCLVRMGTSQICASLCSSVIAFYSLIIEKGGMEVVAALPLIFLVASYRLSPTFRWTTKQALTLGFIASLVILSRLDAGILIALLFCLDGISQRFTVRQWARRSFLLASGSSAVAVYLLVNIFIFGTLLPISGQAKQLRFHHYPSPAALRSLMVPFSIGKALIIFPTLLAIAVAMPLLLRTKAKVKQAELARAISVAFILFPLVHLSILSVLSDWPLWSWYFYSLIPATLSLGFALSQLSLRQSALRKIAVSAYYTFPLFVIVYSAFVLLTWSKRGSDDLYLASRDLENFSVTHPGRYAMGDRAGTPGFLIQDPMIQLEGLVMDRSYLANIRGQSPLLKVLSRYGVRYYIATNPAKIDGCYRIVEPAQAGPDSPTMRDEICGQPVARYVHGGLPTLVFDLQK